MNPKDRRAEVEIEIPFHDVDSVGIVWHGHYAKYFELARCELLKTFNYNYDDMLATGYGWPVIDMHIRYANPCRFGQKVHVEARLVEWEYRMRIAFTIRDAESGARLCRGHTDQVAVNIATGEMCFRSPPILFERLGIES